MSFVFILSKKKKTLINNLKYKLFAKHSKYILFFRPHKKTFFQSTIKKNTPQGENTF
jgi:hypothetical protein